jgi:hypothetical protein
MKQQKQMPSAAVNRLRNSWEFWTLNLIPIPAAAGGECSGFPISSHSFEQRQNEFASISIDRAARPADWYIWYLCLFHIFRPVINDCGHAA